MDCKNCRSIQLPSCEDFLLRNADQLPFWHHTQIPASLACMRRSDWQVDEKRGSSIDLTFHFDESAMLLDNLMDNHQSKSRPLSLAALVFGSEKWIKDVL